MRKILILLGVLGTFAPHAFAQYSGLGWQVSPMSLTMQAPQGGHAFAVLTFTQTISDQNPFFYADNIATGFPSDFALNPGNGSGGTACALGQDIIFGTCYLTVQYSPSTTGTESATISFYGANGVQVDVTVNGSTVFPPTISSFSPTSGPIGTSVTLTGTNFTSATTVAFNGIAASFTVVSDTQITTSVPNGATTGPISVINPAGTGTSTTNFTVTIGSGQKWVLWETAPIGNTGGRCFDAPSPTKCYELFFDALPTDPNNFVSPANPLNPGFVLAYDNTLCDDGNITNLSLAYNSDPTYSPVGWQVRPTDSASWAFLLAGGNITLNPYTGFNFDGSSANFSGMANTFSGYQFPVGGCPSTGSNVTFKAVEFPSLGTVDISLNFISQPGVLSQPEQVVMSLQENADYSVTATGTVTGPPAPCGPLTFNLDSGQTIGPIYGLNGTFTDAQGGQGQMSIGLFEVTSYIVTQQNLINAGYQASGDGIPIQAWSYDTTATPACAADPSIAQGVAYISHKTPHPHPQPRRKNARFDWRKFKNDFQRARARE